MGERTAIAWCDHTFNPWWGCQKISPGCDNCYAAALDRRVGGDHWGPRAAYRTFGDKHWNEPRRWNEAARKAGERRRVFCASMADVFDLHAPSSMRSLLWLLIRETPHLDWLLLTKRPQNAARCLPWMIATDPAHREPWPNVWLGVTAENQEQADIRIPVLSRLPAAVRFVSFEPALGPADFVPHFREIGGIDWIICGAESGHGARPMQHDWVRTVRDDCAAHGVAFFYKQAIENGRKVELPLLDGRQHVEWPK